MKLLKSIGLFLAFVVLFGCAGKYGKIKNQSRSESLVTQQKLVDNWSDYHIWYRSAVIIFDPKDDDMKILVGNSWGTIKDQASWDRLVEQNTTGSGTVSPLYASSAMTYVREIWGPENQFFGYILHQRSDLVSASVIDANTMRINYKRASFGGP
jgi:hypothetical protein